MLGFRVSIFGATEWSVSCVPHLPRLSQAGWAKHLIRDIAIVLAASVHNKSTDGHKVALSHQVSSSVLQSQRLGIVSKGALHLQRAGAVSGLVQGTLETPAMLPEAGSETQVRVVGQENACATGSRADTEGCA